MKTTQRQWRVGSAGFTLIEVIIGLGMIAIVFFALLIAIGQGFRIIRAARESLRATQIVVGRMEGLRLYRWDQLTNTTLLPRTFTEFYDVTSAASNSVIYAGTLTISTNLGLSPSPTYGSAMSLVTVSVKWTNGVVRTRAMSTFVAQNGIQNYIYIH